MGSSGEIVLDISASSWGASGLLSLLMSCAALLTLSLSLFFLLLLKLPGGVGWLSLGESSVILLLMPCPEVDGTIPELVEGDWFRVWACDAWTVGIFSLDWCQLGGRFWNDKFHNMIDCVISVIWIDVVLLHGSYLRIVWNCGLKLIKSPSYLKISKMFLEAGPRWLVSEMNRHGWHGILWYTPPLYTLSIARYWVPWRRPPTYQEVCCHFAFSFDVYLSSTLKVVSLL